MTRTNKFWLNVLYFVIGLALIGAVLSQISLREAFKYLQNLNPVYLAPLLIFGGLTTVARVFRFQYFVEATGRLRELYSVFAYIRALNYVLPLRLGEPVALVLFKRRNFTSSITQLAPTWILFRACDVLALLGILVVASVFVSLPEAGLSPGLTIVAFGLVLTAIVGLVFAQPILRRVYNVLPDWMTHGFLGDKIEKFVVGLENVGSFRRFLLSLGGSLFIWIFNIAVVVSGLLLFSLPISIPIGALVAIVALAFSLLPVRPPLGLGVHESVWVASLVLLGFDKEQALAGAIAARVAQILVIVVECLFCYLSDMIFGGEQAVMDSD